MLGTTRQPPPLPRASIGRAAPNPTCRSAPRSARRTRRRRRLPPRPVPGGAHHIDRRARWRPPTAGHLALSTHMDRTEATADTYRVARRLQCGSVPASSSGHVYWADSGPPAGRRPVCVLTRDAAIDVLTSVTCAPITRTIRGIRSEVAVGLEHGLPEPHVISCDNVITVPTDALDARPIGHLDEVARAALDRALRYALDIIYCPHAADVASNVAIGDRPDATGHRATVTDACARIGRKTSCLRRFRDAWRSDTIGRGWLPRDAAGRVGRSGVCMAWKRSGVRFPLAPRKTAGQRPAGV